MIFPTHVNPDAILSDDQVDQIIQGHPSAVQRGRLIAHFSATQTILKEMALVTERERDRIASWLDGQGGVYVEVAKAVRRGSTPDLKQPLAYTRTIELLREALVLAENEILTLKRAAFNARAEPQNHEKPWAVRRKDGSMEYHDSRASARRAARGDIVVDCR